VADSASNTWKVLESLHAARERSASREVIAIQQQIAQCEARQKRVADLREGYAARLRSDSTATVSASELRLASQFLSQVEGMLEVLRQQKTEMAAGLARALSDAEKNPLRASEV